MGESLEEWEEEGLNCLWWWEGVVEGFGGLVMEDEDEQRITNTLILGQPFFLGC